MTVFVCVHACLVHMCVCACPEELSITEVWFCLLAPHPRIENFMTWQIASEPLSPVHR